MSKATRRAAFYLRVSTVGQTVENQRLALTTEAERRGWTVAREYEDAAISGAKGREQRPGLDAMLKDATRGRFDVVMVWALDRLGRSLVGLLDTVRELESASVDLYVHQQVIDTTSAAGRLFFHIAGAFAEYEREMIRDRVTAALARLKAKGVKLGRPKVKPAVRRAVEVALGQGLSIRAAARAAGVSEGSAAKIRRALASEVTASEVTAPDPAASESIAPD